MYPVWLIAKSVLLEAIRRREIYVIVLFSVLLIGTVMTIDFFEIEGLTKFYREIALKVMSTATALAVIVLAARQLPREFQNRTIYPLLAKPVSRLTFVNGKLMGVMLAAGFCFSLFMAVYLIGTIYIGGEIPVGVFLQYLYLQLLSMLILACLSFLLSLMLNLDAAITFGVLFFATSSVITNALSFTAVYENTGIFGQWMIVILNYAIPQLTLLDLSEKATHSWSPVPFAVMLALTAYALFFAVIYYAGALMLFRRKAL